MVYVFARVSANWMSTILTSKPYPVLLQFPRARQHSPVSNRFDQADYADSHRFLRAEKLRTGQEPWKVSALEDRAMAGNDLLAVTGTFVEGLDQYRRSQGRTGAFATSMTGSGPACYALFDREEALKAAYEMLSEQYPDIRWIKTALSPRADGLGD